MRLATLLTILFTLSSSAWANNTGTKTASTLFEGGTVIAFDGDTESVKVLYNSSVLVIGDRIARVFGVDEEVAIPDGTERVSALDKIISPGFVDTHRHGWQTAFKTMASNTTLAEYFARFSAFSTVGDLFTAEDIYLGQAAGLFEAVNSGVTTILDHAHGSFSAAVMTAAFNASLDSGARMYFCYGFQPREEGFGVPQQVQNFKKLSTDDRLDGSLVQLGVAYDNFDSSKPEEVAAVVDLIKNGNVSAVTTHHLGGPWTFTNSPTTLNELGIMTNETTFPIVFSHATYITPKETTLLRDFNQYISITPESEMHYGHGHQYAHLVQDQAAIGIDTHSTFSTDMVGQARIWLQSVRLRLFQPPLDQWQVPRNNPMSPAQALYLITRAGGKALRRDDIGVIREGAAADLVVIDGRSPNMLGWADPIAAVVLHSHVGDIQHVMIGGKWRKRDFELITTEAQDRKDIERRFLASAKRVQAGLNNTPLPVLEGNFAPGVPYVSLAYSDVVRGQGDGYDFESA